MTGARGWEVSENIVNGRVECPELWGGIVSRNTLQLTAYPWKNLADNSVVVDVGGGKEAADAKIKGTPSLPVCAAICP